MLNLMLFAAFIFALILLVIGLVRLLTLPVRRRAAVIRRQEDERHDDIRGARDRALYDGWDLGRRR